MDFQSLCAAYLTFLSQRSSYANTVRLHRQFFSTWHDHPTKADILTWHRDHSATPGHANKGLAFLKAMYNWAINDPRPKWTQANPAAGIRRYKPNARERAMASYELRTLLQSLDFVTPKFAAFLIVLLTTGCRMGEARKMRWEHVDLVNGCWLKPTTKNGKPQRIPLPRQACQALQKVQRESFFVFTGHYGNGWSRAAAEKSWLLFRKVLRLDDVTLHDFRRTVASRLYAQEKDLMLVKACLNHYDGSATGVYVRLQFDMLATALQKHADSLYGLVSHIPASFPVNEHDQKDRLVDQVNGILA